MCIKLISPCRSCVSFVGNKREFGKSAKNLHATNIGSTFDGLKRLIFKIVENGKGSNNIVQTPSKLDLAPFHFKFRDESEQFNCIQLLAMLLSELKSYAEDEINAQSKPWEKIHVTGCSISVPIYFSAFSQNALLFAAGIAGLSVESLVRETTAVALSYTYRKVFKKPVNVAFIDFGHLAIQICIWRFTNQSFEVLSETFEEIGGMDIDVKIAKHFIEKERLKSRQLEPHFWVKFMEEVESLKWKMSSDTVRQKLNIGLLLKDEASEIFMDRSEMEEICEDIFDRIGVLMEKTLEKANISEEEIDSVHVVGGSTRIPKVNEIVQNVFGKKPLLTLNKEEAIAKGCLMKLNFSENHPNISLSEGQSPQNLTMRSKRFMKIDDVSKSINDRPDKKIIVEV